MKDEQRQFLGLVGRCPARLTSEQAAWFLNCELHDIPVLVADRLLKPLGNPLPNSHKFFAAAELLALGTDRDWLSKATLALQRYWQRKNARKTNGRAPRPLAGIGVFAAANGSTAPRNGRHAVCS